MKALIRLLKFIKFRPGMLGLIRLSYGIIITSFQAILFKYRPYLTYLFLFFIFEIITIIFFSYHNFLFDYYFLNILAIENYLLSIQDQIIKQLSVIQIITYELVLFLFVLTKNFLIFSVTDYTASIIDNKKTLFQNSFSFISKKFQKLLQWSLIELLFYAITPRGFLIGNFLQLLWWASTFFVIPLLVLSPYSLFKSFHISLQLFIKRFALILTTEFFFETLVFLIGIFLQQIYQTTINQLHPIESFISSPLQILIVAFILYGSSLITIAQTVVVTWLYKKEKYTDLKRIS